MAGHDRKKQVRSADIGRRLLVGMGAGAGVFFAAAAMATGSTVTAAPAKADFEELLDPIIQPILTSLTDSIGAFDPAAALDLTSWSDSFLASLNSIDLAVPSIAEPAAAAAAASDVTSSSYTIPMTVLEDTEPAVYATIDGGSSSVPLLVDTGSAGLVIPLTDLGSNFLTQLEALYALGTPTGISESGYSGGVDYIYATYNSVPVDYVNDSGATVLSTSGPVDVELYSWDPSNFGSLFTDTAFQNFLASNDVSGILGVGENASGPTTSPFESYGGVLVNVPGQEMVVSATNPLPSYASVSGAPISDLYESVNGGTPTELYDDIDSGGVYGTIPSSLTGSSDTLPDGTNITVTNAAGTILYSYVVEGDSPTGESGIGTSSTSAIDSGVIPLLSHPIYLDYSPSGTGTLFFDND
jgi:hypothetical protein